MKYTTLYLKAGSYDEFFTACEDAGLVVDGEIQTASHNHSLILIGELYALTGATLTDSDGVEYQERVAIPGYHANLRCKNPIGIEHLAIDVDSPAVKFA